MSRRRDHRVQFDFEVDFTDGGAIQGQGFRLDIDGEDITDRELAGRILRDLRLKMVGETRILNKQIIKQHQTATQRDGDSCVDDVYIDLSHTIEAGMITYRGLPAPVICDFLSHEDHDGRYAPGTGFQIGQIDMCSNTGTYLDSPYHRYADGTDISGLPLDRIAELDALTIDVTGRPTGAIDVAQLLPYDVRGRAVLVHTGWDKYWRTDAYFEGHPFLTGGAAEHLVQQGAALVGIDSLNVDDIQDLSRPVHTVLLAAGIPICEHLTNLDRLPATDLRFTAVPAKVKAVGTFPVRAYGTISATPSSIAPGKCHLRCRRPWAEETAQGC